MKRNAIITVGSIFLIVLGLVSSLFFEQSVGDRVATIVTVITAIVGAIALFIQFKRDKSINEANFLVKMSDNFNDKEEIRRLMKKLYESDHAGKNLLTKEDYDDIVVYMEWCEEFASIMNKNIIDFKWIDDLFAYRFFLAVNNEHIQKVELIPEGKYYLGIYKLHRKWEAYKKKNNKEIYFIESSLSKTLEYDILSKND